MNDVSSATCVFLLLRLSFFANGRNALERVCVIILHRLAMKKAGKGIFAPKKLSEALAAICGKKVMPRTEVTKAVRQRANRLSVRI